LKDFDALLAEGRLQELLKPIEVNPGDCIDLPATTVHAIGAGILLCEIQQSSDVTYRVYDWDRMGHDGKPRPLHVKKARDVMDFGSHSADKVEPEKTVIEGGAHETLISSDKFVLERFHVESLIDVVRDDNLFYILCALEGNGEIAWDGGNAAIEGGDSLLLPACLERFSLSADESLTVALAAPPL
jgi:mannose-6-phosphate isomerase